MEQGKGKLKKDGLFGGSRWPLAIVLFFSMVFIANAGLLYVALATDDGLVNEDYYKKGLFYDEGLKGEKMLGWDIGLSLTPKQSAARLTVVISKAGDAVMGASVSVVLKRPATDRYDRAFELSPSGEVYIVEMEAPLGGLWDVEVTAGDGGRSMVKTFRIEV